MVAKLIILTGKHHGKKMALPEGCKLVVGRDEGVAVRLATSEVSRRHCAIRVRDGITSIEDLGSRNGTIVNDVVIQKRTRLKPGDILRIGPMLFEFQDKAPVTAKAAASEAAPASDEVVIRETSEDSVVNWLAEEEPESAETDTVLAKSAAAEGDSTTDAAKPGQTPSGVQATAEADVPPPSKKEFESIAEEAQDIIRRHLEMKQRQS